MLSKREAEERDKPSAGREYDTGTSQRVAWQSDRRAYSPCPLAHSGCRCGSDVPDGSTVTDRIPCARSSCGVSCRPARPRQVQRFFSRDAAPPSPIAVFATGSTVIGCCAIMTAQSPTWSGRRRASGDHSMPLLPGITEARRST